MNETVARFVGEAFEARFVLKLYDAAIADRPDTKTIVGLMGKRRDEDLGYPSISEIYGRTEKSARGWALEVMQEAVSRKLAGRCYPTVYGDAGSYEQAWGFDSLLGALWMQMLWLMTGQTRRCLWCHQILVAPDAASTTHSSVDGIHTSRRKTRSDKAFCDNGGKCRAKWNYHHGDGKSSKHARREARAEARRTAE